MDLKSRNEENKISTRFYAVVIIGIVLLFLTLSMTYILFINISASLDQNDIRVFFILLCAVMICLVAVIFLLQHTLNVKMHKKAEAQLAERMHKQNVMTSVLQSFIADDDMDILISSALQTTGEIMEADRILLAELDVKAKCLVVKVEMYKNHPSKEVEPCKSINFDKDSFLQMELAKNNSMSFAINDVHESGYDEANAVGVKSAFVIPIYTLGEFWGILEYDKNRDYNWQDEDIYLANVISGIISGGLTRRSAKEKMAVISDFFRIISNPVFELDTGCVFINAYSEDFTFAGYELPELIDRRLWELLVKEDAKRIMPSLNMVAAGHNHIKGFECRVVSKNGEICDYSLDIQPIYNSYGNLTAFRASYTDITEKKNKDRELIRLKDMAERANKAKSEFLSRMSHEIRTPMNAIIGMANIAKKTEDQNKMRICLKKIDDASKHLLGVINDILDMSKIEANKFELSEAAFSLSKMIANISGTIRYNMNEKKQVLTVNIPDNMPDEVIGDEQRLSQVIMNLLSNAIKFSPNNGRISLSVSVEGEDDGKIALQMAVRDNGIGISAEQQARLFQSFEQADGSIARKFGGTGLGLAISKSIIELMGGRIWIESEIGSGAEFIFIIYLKKGLKQAEPAQNLGKLEIKYEFAGHTLLLAEDIEINREIIEDMLSDTGVAIDMAKNGLEALELFENQPERYSLILMDIHMPEMDGYQAAKKIRANGGAEAVNVPIIALTADVFREDIEKCLNAGMNDHVCKPVDEEDLLEKINKYLVI